ncbi:MAG: PHP-associated domain-containing protein [Chloroflexota bacterium]
MPFLTVELHCHTRYSRDSLILPDRLLELCRRRGLDRIAITDHNTIAGAREAAHLDPGRVIIGEEIHTTEGELLAFFLQEEVPPGLTPEQTIARLRAQGALISVSHPFDSLRSGGWSEVRLRTLLPMVDALEVFNARVWSSSANHQAAALATELGLLGTAGSDAHAYAEVGRVRMQLPSFDDASGFRQALIHARIVGRRSSPLVHLASRWATWCKALGWRPATGRRPNV